MFALAVLLVVMDVRLLFVVLLWVLVFKTQIVIWIACVLVHSFEMVMYIHGPLSNYNVVWLCIARTTILQFIHWSTAWPQIASGVYIYIYIYIYIYAHINIHTNAYMDIQHCFHICMNQPSQRRDQKMPPLKIEKYTLLMQVQQIHCKEHIPIHMLLAA